MARVPADPASAWRAYPEIVRGDGDGWVESTSGLHWGRYGAAGLLLRAPWNDGTPAVLLQHRAPWSHQGGTWGLPGGALDSEEDAQAAAKREAYEEAGLAAAHIDVRTTVVTARVAAFGGGTWTYTTVVADAVEMLEPVANRESTELRWVPEAEVADLLLHPAFARSWPGLRTCAEVPAHDCRWEQPHTVVNETTFHWCTARTRFNSARR